MLKSKPSTIYRSLSLSLSLVHRLSPNGIGRRRSFSGRRRTIVRLTCGRSVASSPSWRWADRYSMATRRSGSCTRSSRSTAHRMRIRFSNDWQNGKRFKPVWSGLTLAVKMRDHLSTIGIDLLSVSGFVIGFHFQGKSII